MTDSSSRVASNSRGMPHMERNWLLTPAISPSLLTTRMPSAVDSSVAVSSDMASRRLSSLSGRCEVSRTAAIMLAVPSPVRARMDPATSAWNSVPSRRSP